VAKLHHGTRCGGTYRRAQKSVTVNMREPMPGIVATWPRSRLVVETSARPSRRNGGWAGRNYRAHPDWSWSVSGYGQTGPYRERAGFGAIGEAMGGLRYVTGHRTGRRCGWASASAMPWPRSTA